MIVTVVTLTIFGTAAALGQQNDTRVIAYFIIYIIIML